jgi:hypothetical protein
VDKAKQIKKEEQKKEGSKKKKLGTGRKYDPGHIEQERRELSYRQ